MPKLRGHVIVADVLSEDMGFRERITRQAIERALARKPDVLALFSHDYCAVLGRVSAGTLELRLDSRGLLAVIEPPDTTAGRDVLETVKRGDTRGASFAFYVPPDGEDFFIQGETLIRTVTDMVLFEVSVGVARPAYPQTSIEVVGYAERSEPSYLVANEIERLRFEIEAG